MHEQVFISGVWHSGTRLIAEIAKLNGYDLGKTINSKNDNNSAWRDGITPALFREKPEIFSSASSTDHRTYSVKGILEKSWPFDIVSAEENELFKNCILNSYGYYRSTKYNCCKLPGLSLMTPHIARAFPKAPIIHVIRNPLDISLSKTDNYFLGRLITDKTYRELQFWEAPVGYIIDRLFMALGELEWRDIEFKPSCFTVKHNRKEILWNLLYVLRWTLMIERLRIDIQKHNVQNHHIIKFEDIVLENPKEIEKLKQILGVTGPLKIPSINQSKAYKAISFVSEEFPRLSDAEVRVYKLMFNEIYELCRPLLQEFGYKRVIEFMEKQDFINA